MLTEAQKQENLNLSFNKIIADNFEAVANFGGVYVGKVYYNDPQGNPNTDDRDTSKVFWIHVRYVSGGVGLGIPTTFQTDCYYRVGEPGSSAAGDRYGHKVTAVASDLISAMAQANLGKPIYDFSTTPLTPTDTEDWLLIQNSRGKQGFPESRQRVAIRTGLHIEVLTWHVWFSQDKHSPQSYF